MDEQSVDELSTEYLQIRKERDEIKQYYDHMDKLLEEKIVVIESKLLDILNKQEASSVSTKSAIVIRRISNRYNPSNWNAVYDMIHKHKAFGLLQKRVHDTNMKQFLEENPDEYPEGLNVDSRYAITVKRKPQE